MINRPTELALDADGLPILTDRVWEDELATDPKLPGLTMAEIADELLASEIFQQQLDAVATELSHSIRLQVEQALGVTLENAISQALENNSVHSLELIRQQLEQALPEMLAKAIQDEGLST
jgi:hypothetical protein